MHSSLYAASSVLTAHLRGQEIAAHNLANVTTQGFKRHVALFQPFQTGLDSATADAGQGDYVVDFMYGCRARSGAPKGRFPERALANLVQRTPSPYPLHLDSPRPQHLLLTEGLRPGGIPTKPAQPLPQPSLSVREAI